MDGNKRLVVELEHVELEHVEVELPWWTQSASVRVKQVWIQVWNVPLSKSDGSWC